VRPRDRKDTNNIPPATSNLFLALVLAELDSGFCAVVAALRLRALRRVLESGQPAIGHGGVFFLQNERRESYLMHLN
jgi:hypothetical protein